MSKIGSGPSYIGPSGTKRWYNKDGDYHRLDGPAIEYPDAGRVWFINGDPVSVRNQEEFENSEEYKEYMRLENLRAFE